MQENNLTNDAVVREKINLTPYYLAGAVALLVTGYVGYWYVVDYSAEPAVTYTQTEIEAFTPEVTSEALFYVLDKPYTNSEVLAYTPHFYDAMFTDIKIPDPMTLTDEVRANDLRLFRDASSVMSEYGQLTETDILGDTYDSIFIGSTTLAEIMQSPQFPNTQQLFANVREDLHFYTAAMHYQYQSYPSFPERYSQDEFTQIVADSLSLKSYPSERVIDGTLVYELAKILALSDDQIGNSPYTYVRRGIAYGSYSLSDAEVSVDLVNQYLLRASIHPDFLELLPAAQAELATVVR